MNVFVLCTGRCGSTTFVRACSHFTNFTAGHETRSGLIGEDQMAYPERYIEADSRLAWRLGRLERAYGDRAYYVHLRRDDEEVAASYAARRHPGTLYRMYRFGVLMDVAKRHSRMEVTRDAIDTINANIEGFLQGKSHVMRMRLETAQQQFPEFCSWIGAEGDLAAAAGEWSVRHNAGPHADQPVRRPAASRPRRWLRAALGQLGR